MVMREEDADVRRRNDGSIDYDHYNRKASSLRIQAMMNSKPQILRFLRAFRSSFTGRAEASRAG